MIEVIPANQFNRHMSDLRASYPTDPSQVQWVVNVDSPFLLGGAARGESHRAKTLNKKQPFTTQRTALKSIIIKNGPLDDAVAPSPANIILGNQDVTLFNGFVVEPGDTVSADAVNLADLYWIPLDVTQIVRLWFVS